MVSGDFLGHPIARGVHPEFLKKLQAARTTIDAEYKASGNPVPAGYGIASVGGFRSKAGPHAWGLAIDIDVAGNPFVMHEGAAKGLERTLDAQLVPVYHRIAEFMLNSPVAGVNASMATIEQATMPYAITALKGHKTLRDKADPPLTSKDLNDAEARCIAVSALLNAVAGAAAKGTKPDDFIKDNAAAVTGTGLSDGDVKTMFDAVALKSTIDTLHADVAAKKQSTQEAIKSIPQADRLGIGEGSLSAFINDPRKWGENKAPWQRQGVNAMPGDVGKRIDSVATSESGAALASAVVRTRVDAQRAKQPVPGEEEIVKAVSQQNNPGEADYGENIWKTYHRLYPNEAAGKK